VAGALSAEWLSVLATFAAVATALIGFTGLVTAFRLTNDPLTPYEAANVRILLIFGAGALLFALLPMPFAGLDEDRVWPVLSVLLAGFLLFWPFRSPFWNRARGIKPRRPKLYWGLLAAEGVLGGAILIAGVMGRAGAGTYAAGIAWCLLIAIVTFVAQVFTLFPIERR
jgi:hypothetical protein